MSIRKVKRKKGIAWEVRLQDSTGKDYYKTFPKKFLAEEYENAEKLRKLEGYVTVDRHRNRKQTFKDLCDEFQRLRFPKIREGSKLSYKGFIDNFIIPNFGTKRVFTFNKNDMALFENRLIASGYASQHIHNITYFLSTLMNFAVNDLDWIDKNPTKNRKGIKRVDEPPRYWEKQTIDKFFSHSEVRENYYFDLYVFLINTGCRIGEAGGLRCRDIEFEKNRIYVGWTLAKNDHNSEKFKGIRFSLNRQKGADDRHIPMNKITRELLERLCQGKASGDFVFQNRPKLVRKFVLRDSNGKETVEEAALLNTQSFSFSRFKPLQEKVGIHPDHSLGAHGLRHTFASHYVMNGGNLYTLSKLLGHSSIQITEKYAHLSPNYLESLDNFVNFG